MVVLIREKKTSYGQKQVDQDGLWKKVIDELFEDFMLFFMPELHVEIDFKCAPEFLDKELFQEVIDEKKGRRHADRLVKVQLKSGETQWILIHVEVQSAKEADFSKRMFQYFYRIFDRHEEEIVAISIHTGIEKDINMMKKFSYKYFGTKLDYSYNNYRTEDYLNEDLTQSPNIFSKVILAAKAVHATKNKVEKRYRFKRELLRDILQDHRYSRTKVIATLYFIDYILRLPEEETKKLSVELGPIIRKEQGIMELYNEETAPPVVKNSFAERLARMERRERKMVEELERSLEHGMEKGIEKGIERGIEQGISLTQQKAVRKMRMKGLSDEVIMEIMELTQDELNQLESID